MKERYVPIMRRSYCYCNQLSLILYLLQLSLLLLLSNNNNNNSKNVVTAMPWVITIAPYDDECYLIRLPSKTKQKMRILTGSYEMLDDDSSSQAQQKISAEPLLVYITENMMNSKSDRIIWRSQPNESIGSFRIPIQMNDNTKRGYWICIQNSNHAPDNREPEKDHPDHIERRIGFDYRIESIVPDIKPSPLVFSTDHSDEWREKSALVQKDIRQLMTHRDYMHTREADHRRLVEYTFDDISSWMIIETTLVIVVAVCQVLYLRRFLEKKQRF